MAFIGEAVVSTLVEQLTNLAIEELHQQVRLVVGVKDQVKKLTKNLQAIQAVLADAEPKQLKDAGIRLWLDDLKEISYEMDDVLDEWRSAMLMKSRDQVEAKDHPTASLSHAMRKVHTFITICCFHWGKICPRRSIARKIKDLNESLNEIADRRKNYNLSPYVGGGAGEQVQGRLTISDNIIEVIGRAEEEKKIINMLLGASCSTPEPQIISIAGMGGLGKTTLAQLVYNNTSVKEHFNERIWVCVSYPFDEIKIAKAILESLGSSGGSELQTMVQEIKNRTSGKKFLLVLDDVWNEDRDKWEKIKAALMCGLSGSVILITTRKENVAKIMGCVESNIFRPGHLSKDECWSIISRVVVSSAMSLEEVERLAGIGRQIAEKCKGLPLAAKALGGVLHSKVSRQEWQSVLDSEMWQLGVEEVEIERYLFAPLWLSYHDLSPAQRQCLSFCTCFPKDYYLDKYLLIFMWIAQGYVKEAKTKDMEMVGEEYIRNLNARSFFQDFQRYDDGKIERFKMHDIVHDFVQFMSKKECLFLEDGDTEDETWGSLSKSVRHLHCRSMDKFPGSIFRFKKLRSLFVYNCNDLNTRSLFNELTCLRSLLLAGCDFEEIPSSIGRLVHLRLLFLQHNKKLRELPETVGDLCNLQNLLIFGCFELEKLPRGIEKLSNLRYLEYHKQIRLTQGIERLSSLKLALFIVDECIDANSEVASLEHLRNMNRLSSVHIELWRNVKHVDGAKQAQLNKKKHLVRLVLRFKEAENEAEKEAEKYDEELIEALQLCSNLEELVIRNYLGPNFNPSWLLSLNHLKKVRFALWGNCSSLPPLGKLPSLETLELYGVRVKKVGLEFLGIEINKGMMSPSVVAFPKLKRLEFFELEEWEEWEMDQWGHFSIMPYLTHLSVTKCKKLKALPDHLVQKTTLEHLQINGSPFLIERYHKDDGVDWPKISHIPYVTFKASAWRSWFSWVGVELEELSLFFRLFT